MFVLSCFVLFVCFHPHVGKILVKETVERSVMMT